MRKNTGKYNKQLRDLFDISDNIVMICHQNPDGDAIGSMLGLYHYLKRHDKSPVMISPGQLPSYLNWMKNIEYIINNENDPGKVKRYINNADLLIMLDFNNIERSGKIKDHIPDSGAKKILIDHHPDPDVDADLLISEPEFSSTAELVFELITNAEGEPFLDKDFIEAIYVGMMTDTGNFSYGTFNGDTLRVVASMMDNGLDRDKISDRIYDNFSLSRIRLQGFACNERLVCPEDQGAGYIYLSRDDLESFDHKPGDTEGFVNIPLSIKGVIMSALFIEKKDHIKISFRSKGDFDVNNLAVKHFNGGGHKNASGGKFYGTLKQCRDYFEKLLHNLEGL